MSKLIRNVQKRGTALFLAMQLTGLIVLSLLSFIGGPQSRDGGTRVETRVTAPLVQTTQTDQAQTETAQPITAADKEALRK